MRTEEALISLKFKTDDTPDIKEVETRRINLINDLWRDAKFKGTPEETNQIDQWYDAAGILHISLGVEKENRVYGYTKEKSKSPTPEKKKNGEKIIDGEKTSQKEKMDFKLKIQINEFLKKQYETIKIFFEKNIQPILKECRNFDYIIFVWLLLLTIAFIIKNC